MDKSQIDAAKARAQYVIDGLSRVKDQQARDVLNLLMHIEEQNRVVSRLENKLRELEAKIKVSQATRGRFDSSVFGDVFK